MDYKVAQIPGYEGLYEIDTLGRIWSLNHPRSHSRKQLGIYTNTKGYVHVTLTKNKFRKTYRVHRLVAKIFIPNPDDKPEVNHKSGIKRDNSVSNLEWATPKENMSHSFTVLRRVTLKGEMNASSKLTREQVIDIWKLKGKYPLRILSEKYGVTMTTISYIHTQRKWKWLTDVYK